ncbi:hypothetical protein [Paracoccus sp. (in: a-proteobacteria)]|uniref:hypothetical protein n=1 Tax=Paracoccus sp. TaxID=267 RepID=UPI003A8832BF
MVLVIALAGCEAQAPQTETLTTDEQGNPIVVLPAEDVAQINRPAPHLQPQRLTRDGQAYLLQMRETPLPSASRLPDPDPADNIVSVDSLLLEVRNDVAASRVGRPFTLDDREEATSVVLDFCQRMGWTTVTVADRQTPQFRPINAPGDSNEWTFPNWCLPYNSEQDS